MRTPFPGIPSVFSGLALFAFMAGCMPEVEQRLGRGGTETGDASSLGSLEEAIDESSPVASKAESAVAPSPERSSPSKPAVAPAPSPAETQPGGEPAVAPPPRPAGHIPLAQRPAKQQADGPVPLNKKKTVRLDRENGRLLLEAEVVLREGLLEMLVCKKQTKEHESILAVDADAYVIHTGLLALDVEPGRPVKFRPEFQPPSGPQIDIYLNWTDEEGRKRRVPAQNWVRYVTHRYYAKKLDPLPSDLEIPEDTELRYDEKHKELLWYGPMSAEQRDKLLDLSDGKAYESAIRRFFKQSRSRPMEADWVFAGSFFHQDEQTGRKIYQAEGGDVICVANFPTATLDVAMRSTASGESNLLFEAYTERIPPLGTQVTVELVPASGEDDAAAEGTSSSGHGGSTGKSVSSK